MNGPTKHLKGSLSPSESETWDLGILIAWVMFRDPEIVRVALENDRAVRAEVQTDSIFKARLEGRIDSRLDSASGVYRPVMDRLISEHAIRTALDSGEISAASFEAMSEKWLRAKFIYNEDSVEIEFSRSKEVKDRYVLEFDVTAALKKWPEGRPNYTVQEIAINLNERYGVSYGAVLCRLDEAAKSGQLKLIDPQTDMHYSPDLYRNHWDLVAVRDFNNWAETNGYEYRLPSPGDRDIRTARAIGVPESPGKRGAEKAETNSDWVAAAATAAISESKIGDKRYAALAVIVDEACKRDSTLDRDQFPGTWVALQKFIGSLEPLQFLRVANITTQQFADSVKKTRGKRMRDSQVIRLTGAGQLRIPETMLIEANAKNP